MAINVQLKNAGGDILYPQTDWNLVQNKPSLVLRENNNIDYGTVHQFSEGELPSPGDDNFISSLFQMSIEKVYTTTGNLKIARTATTSPGFPYAWGSILAVRSMDTCGYLQWGSSGIKSLYCGGGSNGTLWHDQVVVKKELQSSLYCASNSLIQSIFTN